MKFVFPKIAVGANTRRLVVYRKKNIIHNELLRDNAISSEIVAEGITGVILCDIDLVKNIVIKEHDLMNPVVEKPVAPVKVV